jgi:hypothetical protein
MKRPLESLELEVELWQTPSAMLTGPRFIILKYMGKSPSMATCERCHVKFFTPLHLIKNPLKAKGNLHDQFSQHTCRPEQDHPK